MSNTKVKVKRVSIVAASPGKKLRAGLFGRKAIGQKMC